MQETWKRPVLIGLETQLLDQAEEMGLDVAEIAQRALKRAVAAKSRRFTEGNVTVHGPERKILRSGPHPTSKSLP